MRVDIFVHIVLYYLTVLTIGSATSHESLDRVIGDDYSHHPCRRICHRGEKSRLCEYTFKVEWYLTMSRACFDCPNVASDCLLPGCLPATGQRRPVITVNRHFPGPSLEVCVGDRVRVNIKNAMNNGESVTIHFHGVKQRASPFMDGVPMVSQCPILPDTTFTLEFDAVDVGTHFWHAHSGFQRADGLAGAFIVRDPYDPHATLFDIDNHAPIIVQDWYDRSTAASVYDRLYYGGPNADTAMSKALLINGFYGAGADVLSSTTIPKFEMDSTKRHRFRVINNAFMECPIKIALQGHHLVLIASDGQPIKAQPTKSLTMYPAERFDFIPVFDGGASSGFYLLEVTGLAQCSHATGAAQFVYIKAATPSPNPDLLAAVIAEEVVSVKRRLPAANGGTPEVGMLESLSNAHETIISRKPDVSVVVEMDFEQINDERLWPWGPITKPLTPRMNQISFHMPPAPIMSQPDDVPADMFCNATHRKCAPNEFCECLHTVNIPLGSLVELIMIDNERTIPGVLHPMHLHGYNFHVVAAERVKSDLSMEEVLQADRNGTIYRKTNFTVVKDSVTVPPGGYIIVRFVADNPGFWLLHCHVEDHMALGMMMALNVGTRKDLPRPPANWPKCGNWAPPRSAGSRNRQVLGNVLVLMMVYKTYLL